MGLAVGNGKVGDKVKASEGAGVGNPVEKLVEALVVVDVVMDVGAEVGSSVPSSIHPPTSQRTGQNCLTTAFSHWLLIAFSPRFLILSQFLTLLD